jgi:hypothetical protein
MAIARTAKIEIDLDYEGLRQVIEQIIEQTFISGYAQGLKQAECEAEARMTATQAYEDWRAFGPGLLLPGGQHVRLRVAGERNAQRAQKGWVTG